MDSKYGKIKEKKVTYYNEEYIYTVYDIIKKVAEENDIPLKEMYKLI